MMRFGILGKLRIGRTRVLVLLGGLALVGSSQGQPQYWPFQNDQPLHFNCDPCDLNWVVVMTDVISPPVVLNSPKGITHTGNFSQRFHNCSDTASAFHSVPMTYSTPHNQNVSFGPAYATLPAQYQASVRHDVTNTAGAEARVAPSVTAQLMTKMSEAQNFTHACQAEATVAPCESVHFEAHYERYSADVAIELGEVRRCLRFIPTPTPGNPDDGYYELEHCFFPSDHLAMSIADGDDGHTAMWMFVGDSNCCGEPYDDDVVPVRMRPDGNPTSPIPIYVP